METVALLKEAEPLLHDLRRPRVATIHEAWAVLAGAEEMGN